LRQLRVIPFTATPMGERRTRGVRDKGESKKPDNRLSLKVARSFRRKNGRASLTGCRGRRSKTNSPPNRVETIVRQKADRLVKKEGGVPSSTRAILGEGRFGEGGRSTAKS